jgi:hypothetical protein
MTTGACRPRNVEFFARLNNIGPFENFHRISRQYKNLSSCDKLSTHIRALMEA